MKIGIKRGPAWRWVSDPKEFLDQYIPTEIESQGIVLGISDGAIEVLYQIIDCFPRNASTPILALQK